MKHIFLIASLLLTSVASAQIDTTKEVPKWQYVEKQPKPGYDIEQFLKENIHYSDKMKKAGIQGRVVVRFVVNEDGLIIDATVIKGIGRSCDEEALRVVKKMPAWAPAELDGKKLKVYYTMPIVFKL